MIELINVFRVGIDKNEGLIIPLTVEGVHDAVGGYIEAFPTRLNIIPGAENICALADEEGILKGLDLNVQASAHELRPLYGPIVYVGMGGDDFRSLTEQETDILYGIYGGIE